MHSSKRLSATVQPLQDQLNGHTEELKYLMHIDDMRIYHQAAVNVRDWVKQERSRQQSPQECLKGKVESPETFWKDLTEFIDYVHRAMHLGYQADQGVATKATEDFLKLKSVHMRGEHGHITPDNFQGIADRVLEFNRKHCSGPRS